jgi:hypothetical protein
MAGGERSQFSPRKSRIQASELPSELEIARTIQQRGHLDFEVVAP